MGHGSDRCSPCSRRALQPTWHSGFQQNNCQESVLAYVIFACCSMLLLYVCCWCHMLCCVCLVQSVCLLGLSGHLDSIRRLGCKQTSRWCCCYVMQCCAVLCCAAAAYE